MMLARRRMALAELPPCEAAFAAKDEPTSRLRDTGWMAGAVYTI